MKKVLAGCLMVAVLYGGASIERAAADEGNPLCEVAVHLQTVITNSRWDCQNVYTCDQQLLFNLSRWEQSLAPALSSCPAYLAGEDEEMVLHVAGDMEANSCNSRCRR
jgi:hypothetical protein